MFPQSAKTVTLLLVSLVISNRQCQCQDLLKEGLLDEEIEYLDELEGEVDDVTINRDTDCTHYCYSAADKCCGFTTSLWGGTCRSGKSQSPINLPVCKSGSGHPSPPLFLDGDHYKGKFSMTNDGHAVILHFLEQKTVNISGAGTYTLDHVRFHWGENETAGGSEHCIKRVSAGGCARETMEVQLFHYKADKKDLDTAIESGQKNAVLVISLLLRAPSGKSSPEEDVSNPLLPVLNPVLKHLEEIASQGDTVIVKQTFDLSSWLSVPNMASSYFGSLTTPKCKQVVRWVVLQTPMVIKSQDVPPFRSIKQANGQPILDNRRPMQKRNKREVQCFQLKVRNVAAIAETRNPLTGQKA